VSSRHRGNAAAVLWLWSVLAVAACGAQVVSSDEAKLLVKNTPDALKVKHHGGCLLADYSNVGSRLASVQLRNMCPHSGTGFVGNYVVDLNSGRIWSDIDQNDEVDSPRLRKLRERLIKGTRPGTKRK